MSYSRYLLALLLLLDVCSVGAQTATGTITDNTTGQPIAYANIGLPARNIGTVSNHAGRYTLNMKGAADDDSVRISFIGYRAQTVKVSYLAQHPGIALEPKKNELQEVVVRPRDLHHRRLGNTNENKFVIIGFYSLGYQLGTLIRTRHENTYIDSVQINVSHCEADSMFFRLNIAEEVNGEYTDILPRPVYINVATADAVKHLVVDLTPYHLVAHHNFMVSVEVVRDQGMKEIFFCAALMGHPAYVRRVSQAPWTRVKMAGPAISAYITY